METALRTGGTGEQGSETRAGVPFVRPVFFPSRLRPSVAPFFRLLILLLGVASCSRDADVVVVGSKNFTESIILGEMIAQKLEQKGLAVARKLNLGGSFVCHQALVSGELDVYAEYTGTAYAAILKLPPERDPARVRAAVDSVYAERWGVVWTEPLGFNNTFAMLVRNEMARRLEVVSLSEAVPYASGWRGGFGFEFMSRADGLDGLLDWYGMTLEESRAMDLGLIYRAVADGTVDIVSGNSTDGQIEALDLFPLQDDRHYFPPYEAAPVVRVKAVEHHPALRGALRELGGTLTEEEMRRLNYLVDAERRDIAEVVAEYLAR